MSVGALTPSCSGGHRPPLQLFQLPELEIAEQSLLTALAAEATFFVAAEGTGRIELVVGLGPDDAGTELRREFENFAAFVRPHAGTLRCESVTPVKKLGA